MTMLTQRNKLILSSRTKFRKKIEFELFIKIALSFALSDPGFSTFGKVFAEN